MAVSNNFSVSVNNSVPAWFSALGHKQWATPVTNNLYAVRPSPLPPGTSNLTAYSGMGVDQSRKWLFMLANGGHNDYYGNEVYSCDLTVASPAWVRRRNPTSVTLPTGSVTKFPDGRPSSDHSTNLHIEAEGRWLRPGMASTNDIGDAGYSQWWEYKPFSGSGTISGSADDWVDLGSGHAGNGSSVAGLALWDSVDRQILVFHNNATNPSVEFQSIDNMSGAPALTNANGLPTGQGLTGSIDTTNRIVLVRGVNDYMWLKLTNSTTKRAAWQMLTPSGSTAPAGTYQMHWHAPSAAYITWNAAGGLKKLTPTVNGSGNYTALVWSDVSGGGGPTPDAQGGLMYNRINLINDMGDGTAAMVVVPRYITNTAPDVYVMRLTGAV